MSSNFGGSTASGGYHHRSAFKRAPKPFKGKSKGKQECVNRGKVDGKFSAADTANRISIKLSSLSSTSNDSKLARHNRAKQLQSNKRAELLASKRIGSRAGPPRLIALVALGATIDLSHFHQSLVSLPNVTDVSSQHNDNPLTKTLEFEFGGQSKRFTFYHTPRDQHAILDIAKVADILCFVLAPRASSDSANGWSRSASVSGSVSVASVNVNISDESDDSIDVDDFGSHAVTILKAQGLTSVIGVTFVSPAQTQALSSKRQQLFRRTAQRYFHTAFPEDCKIQSLTDASDAAQLMRWLTEMKLKSLIWRENRSYLLGQKFDYNENEKVLRITGFLRGNRPLSADQLVHLTGYGDYQLQQIEGVVPSSNSKPSQKGDSSMSDDTGAVVTVLSQSTPETREPLISLSPVDSLANEQSIITDEEIAAAEDDAMDDDNEMNGIHAANGDDHYDSDNEDSKSAKGERRDVQSAWHDALDLSGSDDDANGSDDNNDDDGKKSIKPDITDTNDDDGMSAHALKSKFERDELEFPDEVSYSMDTVCRERFARYRGLKSFKASAWDVRENLPLEYGQIFQFADFKHSRAAAMKVLAESEHESNWVESNQATPVVLVVLDVDASTAASIICAPSPVCVFSLYSHEHKVSVAHYLVQRFNEYVEPIKSKEPLEFHCSFRRFTSRPIFSHYRPDSDNKAGKAGNSRSLMERFFHHDKFIVATVYQRIMFPPAPVILFMPSDPQTYTSAGTEAGNSQINPIVASGSLLTVDPDRLLLKRVILTGTPISTHKRHATVRHMFFNASDVNYFRPVELHTKMGLVGHIVESRGLKGHMKCLFDGHIRQNDTVCLSLYKRQFPPFDPAQFGEH